MRRVLLADLLAVAGWLAPMPPDIRPARLAGLIERAHLAHKVSRRLGHPHAAWGNGCLTSALSGLPHVAEGVGPDPEYLDSLALAAGVIAERIRRGRVRRMKVDPSTAAEAAVRCPPKRQASSFRGALPAGHFPCRRE
ncbi:DUF7742 family protein [Rhodobacter sp. NSM]|uniref:DUF7742 family protein n=1 Tax=Rhodobacter sp. NSM TaxID=3457501 RepID=UPI003FD58610